MCLEVIFGVQVLPQDTVVVDLAVDGKGEGFIIVDEGLSTGVWEQSATVDQMYGEAALVGNVPTPTMHRRSWVRTARHQLASSHYNPED